MIDQSRHLLLTARRQDLLDEFNARGDYLGSWQIFLSLALALAGFAMFTCGLFMFDPMGHPVPWICPPLFYVVAPLVILTCAPFLVRNARSRSRLGRQAKVITDEAQPCVLGHEELREIANDLARMYEEAKSLCQIGSPDRLALNEALFNACHALQILDNSAEVNPADFDGEKAAFQAAYDHVRTEYERPRLVTFLCAGFSASAAPFRPDPHWRDRAAICLGPVM
jgi:hypothetical protein